jgi:hypothetical protein
VGVVLRILCECGEFISGATFKDYIETSSNPSTPTIGHKYCGLIFNFIDGELPKKYSSKKELKCIAMRLAELEKLDYQDTEKLLLEVDRLKSTGKLSDGEILARASKDLGTQSKI